MKVGSVERLSAGHAKIGHPDFPFYSGRPVGLSAYQWLAILLSLAVAFAALVLWPASRFPATIIPVLIFVGLPLLTLRLLVGVHWMALFRKVGRWQIAQMIGFGLLTTVFSAVVALILIQFVEMHSNPMEGHLAAASGISVLGIMLLMVPQLIGEELITILPFLALLWLFTTRLGLSRTTGIILGLVLTALLFGAIHLPTYGWNWAQALVGISAARIVLTIAYLTTRNLWVSAGAHILNDWTQFGVAILLESGRDLSA